MSQRCYINARFLTQEATGVQRAAGEIVKALDAMIDRGDIDSNRVSFQLLAPRQPLGTLQLKRIPLRTVGMLSGHLWEQFELPRHARDGILINLCNTGPVLKRNQLVIIHDAGTRAMTQSYTFAFRNWYRFLIFVLGKNARRITTVSRFSRQELADRFGIPAEKIEVIHNGGDHIAAISPDDSILDRHALDNTRYLLTVSSLNPRKNFQAIVGAVERLGQTDFTVAIAGGVTPRVFGNWTLRFPDRFRCLGYVNDSELRALYTRATALIYPSLYEGFGLPPLEAMTCGCPVVVSDIPPHREVCGDAALYCNPHDKDDIADKIDRIMNDETYRRRLIQDGRRRAAQFTWKKTTTELYRVLEKSLMRPKG